MNGYKNLGGAIRTSSRGFTLIELLTVVAIIALLIGILVPSLSKARDSAKKVRTQAMMKALGDGLVMFVSENDEELRGNNYPPSKVGDDPTEAGNGITKASEDMGGAQWLVRYLMGKDGNGYIAKKNVPAPASPPAAGSEQVGWYDNADLPRSGPYITNAPTKAPKELPGSPVPTTDTTPRYNNPVFVDSFGMPILYYVANSAYAGRGDANPTTCVGPTTEYPGIYTYWDNTLFSGFCTESGCTTPPEWDFGGGAHKLNFGPDSWKGKTTPPDWKLEIPQHPNSFAFRILANKSVRGSDNRLNSAAPARQDSFILLSPGKDLIFGTADDVMNFGG